MKGHTDDNMTIESMGNTQKSTVFMLCLFSFLKVAAETNSASFFLAFGPKPFFKLSKDKRPMELLGRV